MVDETSPLTYSQWRTWNLKSRGKNSQAHDFIHKCIIWRSITTLKLSVSCSYHRDSSKAFCFNLARIQ